MSEILFIKYHIIDYGNLEVEITIWVDYNLTKS